MRLALAIALVLSATAARAATPLCLAVHSDADEAGFRKLVGDELAHHPSHRVVAVGCESELAVELFTVTGTHYLTARINQEVPVRFAVKGPRDVEEKLNEALVQVLQHDPVYLAEDLSRMNAVMRVGTSVVRRGTNRYRLEVFGLVGNGGRNAVYATGAAFTVSRGIDHVQVFARLGAAGSTRSLGDGAVVLRVMAGGEIGGLWEASARANSTFYLGPAVGLHFLRFEGRVDGQEAPAVGTLLLSVALRCGFRFLRFYGFDLDLFAQVHLPLYNSSDPDSPRLVNAYTPYGMAGLGIGF